MMGTFIISWMKNILDIVTYFKEITFSIGAIKKQGNHWQALTPSFPLIMFILVTPIKKTISLK